MEVTGATMYPMYVKILKPDGNQLGSACVAASTGFLDVQTLPADGTYTVLLDPNGTKTGTATVQLHDVPPDPVEPVTIGGPSVQLTVATPCQSAQVTFPTSAGQVIRVEVTGATMYMRVLKPDGSTLTNKYIGASSYTLTNQTLPVAGTYTIVMDPQGTNVGVVTVQVLSGP